MGINGKTMGKLLFSTGNHGNKWGKLLEHGSFQWEIMGINEDIMLK